jgi:hypothetical protein
MNKLKEDQKDERDDKFRRIKGKIMTIARMNRMFRNLRTNSEAITKAKLMSPDGKLPIGLLTKANGEIKSELNMYLKVKTID